MLKGADIGIVDMPMLCTFPGSMPPEFKFEFVAHGGAACVIEVDRLFDKPTGTCGIFVFMLWVDAMLGLLE